MYDDDDDDVGLYCCRWSS